jgi:hypothetical protein
MTDKRPRKPFNVLSQSSKKEAEITRDKDNAQPRVKPPSQARAPGPRLAPPGMSGTKANLSPQPRAPDKPAKRFGLGDPGKLKKEFKPIVTKPPGKGPDISR